MDILANSSLLHKHSAATEKEIRRCEEKRLSLVWFFDICGLQFGIVREVCNCLVLVLWFGDLLSLGAMQLLDLLCGSFFGFYAICIWYLVFVNLWFVFVRKSYLGVFEIWVCESVSTPIYIIPNLL